MMRAENRSGRSAGITESETAREKAIELGANLSTIVAGSTDQISNGTYTIIGLEPGYYLVKDKEILVHGFLRQKKMEDRVVFYISAEYVNLIPLYKENAKEESEKCLY